MRSNLGFSGADDLVASLNNDDTVLCLKSGLLDDFVIAQQDVAPFLDTADKDTEIPLCDLCQCC